jgi:alpha-glucosidase
MYIPTQIHVRGGYIVPMQEPGLTTTESRKNNYSLLVALDEASGSNTFGDLYLDDGETYNTTELVSGGRNF